jgi:methyl-accepting chemotaxis protein
MKLKIAAKLRFGFGIILLLMMVSVALSYFRLATIRENNAVMTEIRIPTMQALRIVQDRVDYSGSKARQVILAGKESERRQKGQQAFDEGWTVIDKQSAILEQLAPHWSAQANRDRLAAMKDRLPKVRQMQQATMDAAATGGLDAIEKAGNDYADHVTPFLNETTKSLDDMAQSFDDLIQRTREETVAAESATVWTLGISASLALAVGFLISITLSRGISHTTVAVLRQAEAIAAGDLSVEELDIKSEDELGDLTLAVNKMQASLKNVIESIAQNAQNVANASEEFSAVSQQISANSEETSVQANTVTSATEQVNRGLQTVASSTEEMSASIKEIARNATEAAKVAGAAMKTAAETDAIVTKLGQSSGEIGQVIKVITSIAQKTDLLALNATVEAARAGEVGAGFAVVANEVKELAKQTANATEDISRKIEAIQADAKSAVAAIASISDVIGQVNDISGTIATAVEEQSATTAEMSHNVSEAARGSAEVAQNIQGVAHAAQSTSQGATDSQRAAKNLAEMSTQLRELVGRFKLEQNGSNSAPRPLASRSSQPIQTTRQSKYEEELAAK